MKPEQFEALETNPEIKKSVLKQGQEDALYPQSKQTVDILYKCRISDYSIIDENENQQSPFSFTVDTPGVIEGLQIGIKTMKIGERAVFEIPAKYAYGKQGSPPRIPANETLYFEAELLKIKNNENSETESEPEKDLETKIKDATAAKAKGNESFRKGNLQEALKNYDEGIEEIEMEDAQNSEVKSLLINLRNNKALICLKLQKYEDCINECDSVLEIEESNIKALLRKGKGQYLGGEFDKAIVTFNQALEFYPEDKEVILELNFARKAKMNYKQKTKNMYQKMFSEKLYHTADDLEDSLDNPVVFLDIKIGDKEPEKLKIRLFKNVAPKTVENFMQLCKGVEKDGEKLHYKGSIFHRVIKGFMMQGGDFTNGNGTGGKSIYGEKFEDENFEIKHKKRGYLSMANAGPNTNGSQFFILFKDTPHLNGKHVVFGKVVENLDLLSKVENLETENDRPVEDVVVVDCGVC